MIISQTSNDYLQNIINYRNLLRQRNYILANNFNYNLIDIYDRQISELTENIINKRKLFFNEIIPICENIYKERVIGFWDKKAGGMRIFGYERYGYTTSKDWGVTEYYRIL